MSRYPQPPGDKGSLRWIQFFVNERPQELDARIVEVSDGRISEPIKWHSPLVDDEFAEYRDESFLDALGVELPNRSLSSFWPKRGPQWDALGTDASGASILVEAKANIPEVVSSGTAASAASREMIEKALHEVTDHLGVESTCDWSGTFYQYANRLAHLYFLSEVNHLDTWLLFVYFVGDREVHGPETVAEWKAGLQVFHGALGLKRHPLLNRTVDVFLEVPS